MQTYTSITTLQDKQTPFTGTLEELVKKFSYILQIGNSYDPKIHTQHTTIKKFLIHLQKAFAIKEGSLYNRTYISLKK